MRVAPGERLYMLLPAVYRLNDAVQGEPLRALLGVIESEFESLESDVEQLYDDWFIETCAGWVVPYLGDLLGVRDLLPLRDEVFSQRALVANTLSHRRRKGTAAMLEQLVRDITGWPARVVEFFELLATTQHLNHPRPGKGGTANLRNIRQLDLLGSSFESTAHTAEVRHIDNGRGKYDIPNIGLFVWRLQPYFVARGAARAVSGSGDGRYRFSPLGNDAPLFNRPRTETEITHLAAEENVPGPLRRLPLNDELEARRQASANGEPPRGLYFGREPVFQIFVRRDNEPVSPEEIVVCDLGDTTPGNWQLPSGDTQPTIKVAVDPVLGRLTWLNETKPENVEVSYAYGFPGDLGGGPYQRVEVAGTSQASWRKTVSQHGQADYRSLSDAIAAWDEENPAAAIITITDSSTYAEAITVAPVGGRRLLIEAANGTRPVLRCAGARGDLLVGSSGDEEQDEKASLTLSGLLIEGGIHVEQGSSGRLSIVHCTLVPGRGLDGDGQPLEPDRPSVTVAEPNDDLWLEIDHSIVGALRLPANMEGLRVRDSIIGPGRAKVTPALVSKTIRSISLSAETPTVNVTIGDEGPHRAVLPTDQGKPTTAFQAKDLLQEAIRAAHDSPAFNNARVIKVPNVNCLIVLPGIAAPVTVEAAGTDPTASELGLDPTSVRKVSALISGYLPSPLDLSSDSPALTVTIGDEGPYTVPLSGDLTTVAKARDSLQGAIRTVSGASEAFASAMVGEVDDQLVVSPGVEGATAIFGAPPTDPTTSAELALESIQPAIAANDTGGRPGPPATLERTTVFGAVHVRELTASETIFSNTITVDRRQVGYVRFSYVPEYSLTPSRFRCQPDLAVQKELEALPKVDSSMRPTEQAQRTNSSIRARIRPLFASTRYGEPDYALLRPECAEEIRTGAEDGGEIGAYNFLQREQRIKNLRASLDEYLRFGLEAGILLVN